MNQFRNLLYLILLVTLAGCTATGQVTTAYQAEPGDKFNYSFLNSEKVASKAIPIFEERLENQLTERGIFASSKNTNAKKVII